MMLYSVYDVIYTVGVLSYALYKLKSLALTESVSCLSLSILMTGIS